MQQPKGFQQFGVNDEILVWKLNKSLYDLKQSGRSHILFINIVEISNVITNYLIV